MFLVVSSFWLRFRRLRTKWLTNIPTFYFIYLFLKILFILERHTERGRDIGRGRSRLPVGIPMWDSIPGLQDHALD